MQHGLCGNISWCRQNTTEAHWCNFFFKEYNYFLLGNLSDSCHRNIWRLSHISRSYGRHINVIIGLTGSLYVNVQYVYYTNLDLYIIWRPPYKYKLYGGLYINVYYMTAAILLYIMCRPPYKAYVNASGSRQITMWRPQKYFLSFQSGTNGFPQKTKRIIFMKINIY